MIAQFTGEDHRNWDQWLPELTFAYNTARHDTTGHTPAFLNYGRELPIPDPVRIRSPDAPDDPGQADFETWHRRLRQLQDAYQLARWTQARAHEGQRKTYKLRRRDWRPQIGDEVIRREHHLSAASRGFNAKLAPKYDGPFRVVEFEGPNPSKLAPAQAHSGNHINARPSPGLASGLRPGHYRPESADRHHVCRPAPGPPTWERWI
ncbi:uncharacterized protein LOC143350688 [Colletes latitarsis]|uniref:uncharacterized protein LOC143350688 n=1 Tax=Colletes latitarsis TaxID=2605962 RepID=UPI004035D9AD